MLLTSIDPFLQEFERQFSQLARKSFDTAAAVMPMDGLRRDDDVVLRFDLPGVDPASVEVTVDRGVLSVTARREEEIGEDERLFVRERPMGTFTRRVYLSEHLDSDGIDHEQQCRHLHGPRTPQPVGQPSAGPGAYGRAQQRDRHHDPGLDRSHPEVVLDAYHRAVDDGAVVPEQKSAGGRGRCDEHDVSQALLTGSFNDRSRN